ncbi:hypothetical protein WFO77_17135 [Yersinia enterocolitica]|nr:hypothetical protein [Yersinia enterocolitica]
MSKENKRIEFFIKFFKEKKYADDFLNGYVYMNRLSYFRENYAGENLTEENNVSDKYEGTDGWVQPEHVTITLLDTGKPIIPITPVQYFNRKWDFYNLFCVFSVYVEPDKDSFSSLEDACSALLPRNETSNLGEYCVIIKATDFTHLFERVCSSLSVDLSHDLVNYFDKTKFSGHFEEGRSIFNKVDSFEHQKEYRFCIAPVEHGTDAKILFLGDIKHIAQMCDFNDLKNHIPQVFRRLEYVDGKTTWS